MSLKPQRRSTLRWNLCVLSAILIIGLTTSRSLVGFQELDGLSPGTLVTFRSPSGASTQQIKSRLGFDLSLGPTTLDAPENITNVQMKGLWLPEGRTPQSWHLSGHGKFELWVDGQLVNTAELSHTRATEFGPFRSTGDWIEFELKGEFEPNKGQLAVSTSTDASWIEPIAAHRLAYESEDTETAGVESHLDSLGRELVHTLQCGKCHAMDFATSSSRRPPPLPNMHRPTNEVYLHAWLTKHQMSGESPSGRERREEQNDVPSVKADRESANRLLTSRMPFFSYSEDDIDQLVAFLVADQEPTTKNHDSSTQNRNDVKEGEKVFYAVGCIACHTLGPNEPLGFEQGPSLAGIGLKRTPEYLERWLKDPSEVDVHATMPKVELAELEVERLVAFLALQRQVGLSQQDDKQQAQPTDVPKSVNPTAGEHRFKSLRCGNCHARSDGSAEMVDLLPWNEASQLPNWDSSCISTKAPTADQPKFRLTNIQRVAIENYLNRLALRTSDFEEPEKKQFVTMAKQLPISMRVRELGCLNCHQRDQAPGITPVLDRHEKAFDRMGIEQELSRPPALNSVGSKLTDEAWQAVLGASLRRRPWLNIRMPDYGLSQEELTRLAEHFRREDSQAGDLRGIPVHDHPEIDKVAGSRLVTSDGFGCLSCHAVKDRPPVGAEPQTLGPSLAGIDRWIEREWFDRWVRDPSRITPRMEMPSIQVAVSGVLDNDLDRQLDALWRSINAPDFSPPAADAVRVVRQTGLNLNASPTVLTDVMRIDGRVIVKPFAIALANRHNIMFDLETGGLSHWWLGDAARQRTDAKTWYWEPAGTLLYTPPASTSETDFRPAILLENENDWQPPTPQGQFATYASSWSSKADAMQFELPFRFSHIEDDRPITMRLTLAPFDAAAQATSTSTSGFVQRLKIGSLNPQQRVKLRLPKLSNIAPQTDFDKGEVYGESQHRLPWNIHLRNTGASKELELSDDYVIVSADDSGTVELAITYTTEVPNDTLPAITSASGSSAALAATDRIVAPGFKTDEIPIRSDWMPTGLSWSPTGELFLTSLKGRVFRVVDTDGDGIEDRATVVGDEYAAPFGLFAGSDYIDVINKYALLRLRDHDNDGHFETTTTLARGWGHTADYHDWAVGLPRLRDGSYLVALSCQQDKRSLEGARYRGDVLRLVPRSTVDKSSPNYEIERVSGGHRFPVGIAVSRAETTVVTDNQGNYNPFNELNHVLPGKRFGFLNQWEKDAKLSFPLTPPAINIPHPWTRSVNGICYLEVPNGTPEADREAFGSFAGQIIGCEYDTRRLVRMSLEEVDGQLQGAVYPFSLPDTDAAEALLGPITCAVSPGGALYVGGIRDSGWGGANNIGTLLRLSRMDTDVPIGIASVSIWSQGFDISLTAPLADATAIAPKGFVVESYTRTSTPRYGGEDEQRRREEVAEASVSADKRSIRVRLAEPLRAGFVYEFNLENLDGSEQPLFPAEAFYTVNRVPTADE